MKNSYEVLGIPENATDEQIKNAYRELARKYQNDDTSSAQSKMRELDEAYDAVIMGRTSAGGQYSRSEQRSYASPKEDPPYSEFGDIRSKIKSGRLDDAETLLDGIPLQSRNAEWHYLKGTVQHRKGWLEEAVRNVEEAVRLDPDNREYKAVLNNLKNSQFGGYRSNEGKRSRSSDSGCSGCDMCSGLICADCCCECMGGDLIRCC